MAVPFFIRCLFFKFQVAGQNQIQLGSGLGHKAAALVEDGLFQRVAGQAAIAGGAAVQRLTALVVAQQREHAALGQTVALAFGQHRGDVQQLVGGVIRELDLVWKAAGKAAVSCEKCLYLLPNAFFKFFLEFVKKIFSSVLS